MINLIFILIFTTGCAVFKRPSLPFNACSHATKVEILAFKKRLKTGDCFVNKCIIDYNGDYSKTKYTFIEHVHDSPFFIARLSKSSEQYIYDITNFKRAEKVNCYEKSN